MLPPAPPWRVLMRRTASRAHSRLPSTLVSNMRRQRAQSISSSRAVVSTTPALFTSPAMGPNLASTVANMRSTSASLATSARTLMALPPSARMARTTASAASESRA